MNHQKGKCSLKTKLLRKKGVVVAVACALSVPAVHAQTFVMYDVETGALMSQSSLPTLSGGAWNGQALPAGNALDMVTSGGFNSVVLLDPDGSVSTYRMDTGALVSDFTATSFVNGPYNGLTLAGNRNHVIGFYGTTPTLIVESGQNGLYNGGTLTYSTFNAATTVSGGPHNGESFTSLASVSLGASASSSMAFLDSDGSVSFYTIAGGGLTADPTATTLVGGLLDGQTFASLLGRPGTENQPGITYLGMDISGTNRYLAFYVTPVPEPSTTALLTVGGLFIGYHLMRRRR